MKDKDTQLLEEAYDEIINEFNLGKIFKFPNFDKLLSFIKMRGYTDVHIKDIGRGQRKKLNLRPDDVPLIIKKNLIGPGYTVKEG